MIDFLKKKFNPSKRKSNNKQKGRGNFNLLGDYLQKNHITYQQYLESEHWQELRKRFLESKLCWKFGHNKCWACGSFANLNVHHRTYIRLGCERIDDLMLLCQSCHELFHRLYKMSDNKNLWELSNKFLRTGDRYEKLFTGKENKWKHSNKPKKEPIKKVSDVIRFGKYHHKNIQYILDYDPEYILWMDENKVLKINPEIISLAVQSSSNKSRPKKYSPV